MGTTCWPMAEISGQEHTQSHTRCPDPSCSGDRGTLATVQSQCQPKVGPLSFGTHQQQHLDGRSEAFVGSSQLVCVSAKSGMAGGIEYYEMGDTHAGFRRTGGPMTNLVAKEPIRTTGGRETGAGIIKVSMPEFQGLDFGVLQKRRGVLSPIRADNVEDELG